MAIVIPAKLTRDLDRKCYLELVEAFDQVVRAIVPHCPTAECRSQKRYSAFYKHGSPFVHIDPQRERILFGFFEDYIKLVRPRLARPDHFALWNESRGGLVGYSLKGVDETLRAAKADIKELILESYRCVCADLR